MPPVQDDPQHASQPELRFHVQRPSDVHEPSWGHRYRYYTIKLMEMLEDVSRDLEVTSGQTILDYGCADVPYRYLFPEHLDYVAADIPGNPKAMVDIHADGTLPLDDEIADAVVSTQVLEHVRDPQVYLAEAFRVLRPGGRLMISTHGIFVYHPDPDDYWRWTCAGLQRALEDEGFVIRRLEGVLGLLPMAVQLAQDAVYWKLPRRLRPLLAGLMQTVIGFVDRRYTESSKRLNASVFVLVAQKPG